ncbi:MAG TPA: prepilin-type N-terminal cleavage/methylation domain-containing protein [Gemmataceae bacterium]|nr:prepilin-type N-terminal cleavage/methylation domain-containing protein [Gemmataceae bacterium]
MTRRPAVTLIEVLVAMFIMAIGMLALLTLFPLGAVSMAQALKDDRCASTAAMAENVATAMNIRHDASVAGGFAGSTMVFVDPNGAIQGLPALGGVIPRVSPSFVGNSQPLADRWFSLPDDMTFLENGTPDTTSGFIDRGRRYSFAYLLARPQATSDNMIELTVVVYSGRPVGALSPESTQTATGTAGANGIVVNAAGINLKRGGWVLDPVNGYFYRVTNIAESGGSTVLDVQPNVRANLGAVTIMEDVAEVFDKGSGWQP